nr:hypothetical protein [Tanacetum cinerariifolium]
MSPGKAKSVAGLSPQPSRVHNRAKSTAEPTTSRREMPLYYPSWQKVPAERKAAILTKIEMESSATREYPPLIHTFFVTHTVNGVFTWDEDRAIYEEMLRLQALGSNTPSDVLIPPPPPPPQCTYNSGDVKKLKKKNKYLTKQVNLMMKLFRSNEKFSQMLNKYESTPEFGSGSGGCGDDEMANDEEDEKDGDS